MSAAHPFRQVHSNSRFAKPGSTPNPVSTAPAAKLNALGAELSFEGGETIFEQGEAAEHYYRMVSGLARVYKLMEDGRRQIIAFVLPGDFFGLGSDQMHDFSAEAVTSSKASRISRAHVAKILGQDAALGSQLFVALNQQLIATQQRLVDLGRKNAKARVASFLEGLCPQSGSNCPSVDLAVSRHDIADYLGLAMETVSRTLSQLRESGVIDLPSHKHVVVCKPNALHAIADCEFATA